MMRSPLAYPLNRSADMDVGGAADLQTDIMRFMAILSLCLVAIFALVQSIPLTPAEPEPVEPVTTEAAPMVAELEPTEPPVVAPEPRAADPVVARATGSVPAEKPLKLTRPKWVPKFDPVAASTPDARAVETPAIEQSISESVPAEVPVPTKVEVPVPTKVERPAPVAEPDGFVLRFESDAALMRAVGASHVGFYAIEHDKAQRMTVSESRVSFWAASTPNTFHEMESATVPGPVIDALARTGADADAVSWGVTLPGKLKTRLDALMEAHQGGSLIIGAAGDIHWEAT